MNRPRQAESGVPVSTLTDSAHFGERDRANTATVPDDGPEAAEIWTREEVRARGDNTRQDMFRNKADGCIKVVLRP
jgi:hypothetical protein